MNPMEHALNKHSGVIKYIARHGETKRNGGSDVVYRGWKEEPANQLDDKGIEDAEELGEEVKDMIKNPRDFVIVTSDLNRARDTGKIVSDISEIKLGKKYYDLRSMDTGFYTGKSVKEYQPEIDKHIEDHPDKPLKGSCESYNEFIARVKKAFEEEIPEDYPGKKILVITHHQVEVLQGNHFEPIGDEHYKKGIKPGHIRKI